MKIINNVKNNSKTTYTGRTLCNVRAQKKISIKFCSNKSTNIKVVQFCDYKKTI